MPVQPPSYEIPQFNPGGSTDLGAAMTEWTQQFGQQYRQGQESLQRLPFIASTFSTGQASKTVQLQGGEQVLVIGYFDFIVSVGGQLTTVGVSFTDQGRGQLRVTYPGGTETTFGSEQEATFRLTLAGDGTSQGSAQRTTVTGRSNVSFTWPIEARFQTGGEHVFSLRSTGGGNLQNSQITVLVL